MVVVVVVIVVVASDGDDEDDDGDANSDNVAFAGTVSRVKKNVTVSGEHGERVPRPHSTPHIREAGICPRGLALVQRRALLVVHGDEHQRRAEGAVERLLRGHLDEVRDAVREVVHGDGHARAVRVLRRDVPRPLHERTRVTCGGAQ